MTGWMMEKFNLSDFYLFSNIKEHSMNANILMMSTLYARQKSGWKTKNKFVYNGIMLWKKAGTIARELQLLETKPDMPKSDKI